MDIYLVRLKCLSPYLTPWRNCTLWGRLSWIVADGRLDGWSIEEWIGCCEEGIPPLVVGDAFPFDAFPVPAMHFTNLKGPAKKAKTLPWNEWKTLCATGEWPPESRLREIGRNASVREIERTHVVIDRTNGTAAEGQLRSERGWQPKEGVAFVALVDGALGKAGLEKLVEALCQEGWGYGRSYGYGQVELIEIERLEPPPSTGWSTTLGHCHPTGGLPQEGYWRWTGVPVRPHSTDERKGPIQRFTTMLVPGASFATNDPFIGQTIAWDGRPDYRHYGLAPMWPVMEVIRA